MSIQIEIPDQVAQAIRLPLEEQKEQLLIELGVALYGRGILSFGKVRELAGLDKYEFGVLLGKRGIPRHYDATDLRDDMMHAHRK
jgi:predicted HTH domain antitoxin